MPRLTASQRRALQTALRSVSGVVYAGWNPLHASGKPIGANTIASLVRLGYLEPLPGAAQITRAGVEAEQAEVARDAAEAQP